MKYHTQYIKLFYRYLSEKISPLIIKANISANTLSISRIFIIILGLKKRNEANTLNPCCRNGQ